ncbi:CotH kinase family protein [Pseudoalteromonas sp. Hal273]
MREVIAYDLMDEMGVPTPEHAYVNFYVNGELFGLYLMVEAIDGEFVEKHFANSNGDLYKPDGTGSDLLWLGDDIQSYTDINLQTNEDTTDNGVFINFVESLDDGETSAIEVDTLLRYMSVSTSLSNLDSYHGTLAHNYYIYDDDGVFSILPWDFNESFGTFNMNCNGVDVRELYIDEPVSGALNERPLIANVFAEQSNLDVYHSYLTQLINGSLSSDTFSARVNEIADLIREHVQNDPTSFYGSDYFEQNLTSTTGQFYGLTSFMQYRVANMTAQLDGTLPSAGDGSGFCSR